MKRLQPVLNVLKQIWIRMSPPIIQLLQRVLKTIGHFWKKRHLTQFLLLGTLTFILLTILFFAYTASQANVQSLQDGLSQTTIIYDKDGDVATEVDTNRAKGVDVKKIPDYVSHAVIAIEDRRFMEHNGFDIIGMSRAFLKNLFSGAITGGGSTITQQLTKNALLSPEQTYKRKIEELFLAVEIEKHYTKNEILNMYLNQVYFGSGAWGIDQAALEYFNKDINNITLSEAALLAGLLQAPSALDPHKHYERAIERRNVVLASMKELDMITEEEYNMAKKEKVRIKDGGGNGIKRKYPYYVDAVLDEAINQYGLSQEEIMTRDYRIYTEMDQNIQASLEKVFEQDRIFPNGKDGKLVQSGSVLLDPKTGGIRGLVGGRGEYVFRGFNRATHIKAQPGSTLKPLAVYTPALEEGYKTTSILKDEEMVFGDYAPQNFSRTFQGEVPMYEAVAQSLNMPTVWLLNEIGLDKGIASLEKFGIPLEKEDHYLGIALGGMSKGISPVQLAEAYSVFANEGKREDGHLITKILGPTGNIVAEHKNKTTKVTSKKVANEITSLLLGVVESGTGRGTQIPGMPIAGKTGSTQLPYKDVDGTKDQWFVGYTPNLVGAVWLGYDQTSRQHYLSSSSSDTVVPIFREIMETVEPYTEHEEFTVKSVQSKIKDEEEKKQPLKDQTEEWKEKLKEEAPKWKEKLDKGIEKGKQLKNIIESIIGQ